MNPRLVWLGVGAFALALLIRLPVRWITGLLPPQLHCAAWSGSVWRGQCAGLTVSQPGAEPLQIELLRWKLRPAGLLRLALQATLDVRTTQGVGNGKLELRLGNLLTLQDVSVKAVLDRRLATMLDPGWTGQLEVQHLAVRLRGRQLQALSGDFTLRDFNDGNGGAFGNYRLLLPPTAAPPFVGALKDTGGPLEVTGSLTISADRHWALNGLLAARSGADNALRGRLDILGAPDANGRYPFSAEGSFK